MAEQRDYDEKLVAEFARTGDQAVLVELVSQVHSIPDLVQEDINELVGYRPPVPEPEKPAASSAVAVREKTRTDLEANRDRELQRQREQDAIRWASSVRRDTCRYRRPSSGIPLTPFVFLLVVIILEMVFHV